MFNQLRIGSALRCVLVMVSALTLPACVDEMGSEGEAAGDEDVEASSDPLVAPEGSTSPNLLTNPGIETEIPSADWPVGNTWPSTSGRVLRTGAARRSGNYGMRMTGFAWMIHKDVATRAGARYAVSGYARKGAYGTTPCWMEVQFYPSGGVYKTAKVSSTYFTAYGVTVTAPAGTTSARIQVRRDPDVNGSQTDEACDWDDFSFRRVY